MEGWGPASACTFWNGTTAMRRLRRITGITNFGGVAFIDIPFPFPKNFIDERDKSVN
jgi:hypothetical protein